MSNETRKNKKTDANDMLSWLLLLSSFFFRLLLYASAGDCEVVNREVESLMSEHNLLLGIPCKSIFFHCTFVDDRSTDTNSKYFYLIF